jgi:hypothetical protein
MSAARDTTASQATPLAPEAIDTAAAYEEFLAHKAVRAPAYGFVVDVESLNPQLFDWQRAIVAWALRRGRAAIFADCGLGKTPMQLEWAWQVHQQSGGNVLILAPLAVAQQTADEATKFGYAVTICRQMADVRPGINITNYELLAKFDASIFSGVVLDESSILKSYMGKTKRALVDAFAETPYRLCCTATPAPNDHMEIGNHSEFLGVMPSTEMLMRWFINDTMAMGNYRLKGHAAAAFWQWVGSWAVSLRKPSDLGYSDDGFTLPALALRHEIVEVDLTEGRGEGQLFRTPDLNATGLHKELRRTTVDRAEAVARLVNGNADAWVVWCNTNYEADALMKRIPDAIEVRGSETLVEKERKLRAFTNGAARVIVTKPSIAGFGLNWQHCHRMAFIGPSYSYEQFYQAVRRCWRFGQTQPVEALVVAAQTEGQVLATIERKMAAHEEMAAAMVTQASALALREELALRRVTSFTKHAGRDWTLYHGDSAQVIRALPDASVHFSIFSPPFSSLYTYSDAVEDMGNCAGDDEFFRQFDFLIPELHRITVPGRLCAVHCKQLVNYKGRDGMAGMRDFRGEIIRHFTAAGWAYHSEVCIWKDPVIEMQRTKAHGLLYKQLRADSSFSRQGMAEYLLVFRRWPHSETEDAQVAPVTHTSEDFPLDLWQRFASPVWFDIRQTRVLNVEQARDAQDEKHICPLQLDVIERALDLWTNPGDVVFSPFAGIGSEGVVAIQKHRRFVGVELKERYLQFAEKHLTQAEREANTATLWDAMDAAEDAQSLEVTR